MTGMSKGIFWDNDGVLSDTEHLFYRTNRDLLAEHGIHLSEERYIDWFLVSNCGAWHLLEERGYTDAQLEVLRHERNARYSRTLSAARGLTHKDMLPIVKSFSKRARMAIVTASFREHLDLAHMNPAFFDHFETIITRETAGRPKPAPDCYLRAMDVMQLTSSDCIVVEDSPRGLAAARAAGIRCVVLRSPLLRNFQFAGATAVVDSGQELANVLHDFLSP